jgi:hypothetical protein
VARPYIKAFYDGVKGEQGHHRQNQTRQQFRLNLRQLLLFLPIMFGLSLVDWPEGPRGGTTFQQVTTDGALTKNLKL